ncbi:MAG: hypothetical protein ACE5E6_02630 [Phycisphaerae bacterium]
MTGADVTPYARAYACGRRGAGTMYEWIWFAGTGRLKHVAMMRASAASRRFARMNVALLAVGLGVLRAVQVGWAWVPAPAALAKTRAIPPVGQGWVHAAEAPRPIPLELPRDVAVDLWWNVPQGALAVVSGMVAGIVLAWVALVLIQAGVTAAHTAAFRGERRMTAAIHYSTVGVVPFLVAAGLAGMLSVSHMGAMARWRWYPSSVGLTWAAVAVAAVGACAWWFWLIRLGATAPPPTRWRVVVWLAVGAPVVVAACSAAWYYGLAGLHRVVVDALQLWFFAPGVASSV